MGWLLTSTNVPATVNHFDILAGAAVLENIFFVACFLWTGLVPPASAAGGSCIPLIELFENNLVGLGAKRWNIITLKRAEEARHLVFTEIPSKPSTITKWIVATRESEAHPENYCIQATGGEVTPLVSLHDWKGSDRFGLPGSGYPRCGDTSDPIQDMKVRGWASRELGSSLVLSLDSADPKTPSFVILKAIADGAWVLLHQLPGESTCYFDRGTDSEMKAYQIK